MDIRRMLKGPLAHQYRILGVSFCILLFAFVAQTSFDRVWFLGIQLPPVCAFRLITGLDCPGCGLTRSVILAAHGNLWQSYLMHIWGIPFTLLILFQLPYRSLLIILGRTTSFGLRPGLRRWITQFVVLSLLLPWSAKLIVEVASRVRSMI